jgi:hypothetical protein
MTNERAFGALGVLALMGFAYFAGTKRTEPVVATAHAETPPARSPLPAPAPAPSPSNPPRETRGPLDMSALDGLGAKLAAEKAMAGESDPNAAGVFAAIQDKLKIPLADKLQPLASPLGAQYCERMTTKNDVYVVVCEFASEETARAGQKKGTNDVVKRREVLQRRASTCAVHQVGQTKQAEDEAKRIKDLFVSL